jgi:NADPH-dependent 2,4-dienoyl-CoA reductase/sulfur reductase-like enzyme
MTKYAVLIVGAGPAGIAAATAAAATGVRVGLIDEQATPGGQVWRRDIRRRASHSAQCAIAALQRFANVQLISRQRVVAVDGNVLLLEGAASAQRVCYERLILANGARELLLPFPGWTLPGVSGAGGLQALVKNGWPIAGKRVVVAGSGPLLLAVAESLVRHRANVLAIVEQASRAHVSRFALQLPRWPSKFAQAIRLKYALRGIPYLTGSMVHSAAGDSRLKSVDVVGKAGSERIECDHLASGYGLVPNIGLAELLGCCIDESLIHPSVHVDEFQRTSLAQVYAAGEVCGIGGVDAARVQGAIAGFAAVGNTRAAAALFARRKKCADFSILLSKHFALSDGVRRLAEPDTIVCRCEDATLRQLDEFSDARSATLATRCGMGACQGLVCGPALTEMRGFSRRSIRPPVFPARLSSLALTGHDSFAPNT